MSKPSFLNSSSASDQFTIKTDTLPFRFGSGVLPATEQLYHKLVLIVPNHNRPNFRVTLLFLKLSTKITGSSPKWKHLLSYNPFNKEMQTCLKPISIRNMYLYNQKYSTHCSVSSNSFHGQITQKAVHQITDPENKKCSHCTVDHFGIFLEFGRAGARTTTNPLN